MRHRELPREIRELGFGGTLFRAGWELRSRLYEPLRLRLSEPQRVGVTLAARTLAFDPVGMRSAFPSRHEWPLEGLVESARRDAAGDILCFSKWHADFGRPIDWYRDPMTGRRYTRGACWSRALEEAPQVGDPKFIWEAARFPHAFRIARACVYFPELETELGPALRGHMETFAYECPPGRGIHWASGQETAVRMLAWIFAREVLGTGLGEGASVLLAEALSAGAWHLESTVAFAKNAVYNNHLLAEAVGLYAAGILLSGHSRSATWRQMGRELLEEQCHRQFYADGGYINLSFTYHRTALQCLLWASVLARAWGDTPPAVFAQVFERSLDMFMAHQAPDGSLPNFGANDGSMPAILSTADFVDFRPICQTLSVMARGERLYPPGPWDEEAAWWAGPTVFLSTPLRPQAPSSKSFPETGLHVLRSEDPGTLATLRCGSVRDRFGQIDMLHTDLFVDGAPVAVDAGSYQYGGPPEWHAYFSRTVSHNTMMVDGQDQMLAVRPFKNLYPTQARVRLFEKDQVAGEHFGFRRHHGKVIHRRGIALFDRCLIVVDRLTGQGTHTFRLHWLLGSSDVRVEPGLADVRVASGGHPTHVTVHDESGLIVDGDVRTGADIPLRGWASRYYGEKFALASLVAEAQSPLPFTRLTVFRPDGATFEREGASGWFILRTSEVCYWIHIEADRITVEPGGLG